MLKYSRHILLLFACLLSCIPHEGLQSDEVLVERTSAYAIDTTSNVFAGSGALLLTDFRSLDDFRKVVQIDYYDALTFEAKALLRKQEVRLKYQCGDLTLHSDLRQGVSEIDFVNAKNGSIIDKALLALTSPYALINRKNLVRIEILGRKRYSWFGEGDVAFYDLAEAMVYNITDDDYIHMPSEDRSEKGYLNTFNHITAQSFITSIFSERLADFIADIHERYKMPELITGDFTPEQLSSLSDGPVDNYVDLINNECGQELGKALRIKYDINNTTHWTPELLANYLNDLQAYNSWQFQIGFNPFRPEDEIVERFAAKINRVIENFSELRQYYY